MLNKKKVKKFHNQQHPNRRKIKIDLKYFFSHLNSQKLTYKSEKDYLKNLGFENQ